MVLALGPVNLLRVYQYRLGIRFGFHPVLRLKAEAPQGPFFRMPESGLPECRPVSGWLTEGLLFSHIPFAVTEQPPNWLANPLTGNRFAGAARPWWRISDFDLEVGDIKLIWELSRFDWVLAFAQRVRNADNDELIRLNHWLADWCAKNQPYCGPNWKCGQEASIRVMHLAMAALILGQASRPEQGLVELIRLHLRRIAPTIGYSIAQDNNHGTSEAAALFIGGSWLASLGINEAERWAALGRSWLEDRVRRLIDPDGSFSQYSVTYHRMMLDTLSMVEVWRRAVGLPEFSQLFSSRAIAAVTWLASLTDQASGDAPNLGANDGARLLQLTDTGYRDFRPSVQLGMVLFTGKTAYSDDGPWNDRLRCLGIAIPECVMELLASRIFDGGGYAVLKRREAMVVLRYPRFRFRPGHADALHMDFWLRGVNVFRDSGTFSYNTDRQWLDYFPGTASHNTVQFDDRDQMPKISRFLYGDWLKTEFVQPMVDLNGEITFGATYRDRQGARHQRAVSLKDKSLLVCDEVSGFKTKAVLRWRLRPGSWKLDGQSLTDGAYSIQITSGVSITRLELTRGWESRYYSDKTEIPVLEIEVDESSAITTEFTWST